MARNSLLVEKVIAWIAIIFFATMTFAQEGSGLPEIVPPEFEGEKTIKLPAVADDLVVGGGGRYLLIHLKELRKIAVFDVNLLKIKGYISAGDDDVKFSAGVNKAILLSATRGVVSRWNLETLERELTKTIDATPGSIETVLLGSTSNGPAMVGLSDEHRHGGEVWEMDLKGLNTKLVGEDHNSMRNSLDQRSRISATGTTIVVGDLRTLTRVGSNWNFNYNSNIRSNGHTFNNPSADGRFVLAANGVYTKDLKAVGEIEVAHSRVGKLRIPATNGPFYLNVPITDGRRRGSSDEETQEAQLMMVGETKALGTISNIKPVTMTYANRSEQSLPSDKRVVFIPDANLIVQVSSTGDSLNCIKFDVEQALHDADIDFLIVTSRPLENLKVDQQFSYQIKACANSKKFTYRMESAPNGMSVNEAGLVTWTPTESSPPSNSVIVSVGTDAGEETFHTFSLKVEGASGNPNAQIAASGAGTNSPSAEETAFEHKQIKLPGSFSKMVVGGSGRYLLFHLKELMKIAVLDVTKGRIIHYIPANDSNIVFAASQDKLIVIGNDAGVITRWNLGTRERELAVNSPFDGSILEIALGSSSQGPAMVLLEPNNNGSSTQFLDIDSLKRFEVEWTNGNQPHSNRNGYAVLFAASQGKYFTVPGSGVVRLQGNQVEFRRDHNSGVYLPSADGMHYFARGRQVNFDLKSTGGSSNYGAVIPAVAGNFFLSFNVVRTVQSSLNPSKTLSPKLFMYGESRPIVSLPKMKLEISGSGSGFNYEYTGLTDRVCFVPNAKVVVTSSPTLDSLTIHRLDLDEALKDSGVDYLFVTSQARPNVKVGEDFSYAMEVKSKSGGLKFKLETGPKGMAVSEQGTVTWKVPAVLDSATHAAIVSVKDSKDQEVFHTITLEVPEIAANLARQLAEKRRKDEADQQAALVNRQAEMRANFLKQEAERQARIEEDMRRRKARLALTFSAREWTDVTGEHKIMATFVRISDKRTVILSVGVGKKEKAVPLNKLAAEDAYHAVECDLKVRRNQAGADGKSPFNDRLFPPSKDGSSNTILLDEIRDGINWGNFTPQPDGTGGTIMHGEFNDWFQKPNGQKDK